MNIADIAIDMLKNQGFEKIKVIEFTIQEGSKISILEPISITDLNGTSNFTIVPLDATETNEFQDLIYVAIKVETSELLEVASISKTPRIYNDQEMESELRQKFPKTSFEITPGYFWKSGLRSFLSTVRRFSIGGKEMFLLPNADITDNLDRLIL